MATKTVKKNEIPKIHKKWYDFEINPATLRPIRFSWSRTSGYNTVMIYDSPDKDRNDIKDVNLRNLVTSYYFVFDKPNKRIFLYPIRLTGHETRSGCRNAHYEQIQGNEFYMFDENKQIWAIPKKEYQRYVRYDYQERRAIYETIEAKPRKVSRLSTYYYKIQCQLTSHIKEMFSTLYGKDFVYQNKLITDDHIRENSWTWTCWLLTKGRKYSDKTIKAVDELMNKFSAEQRVRSDFNENNAWQTSALLDTINDITAICYFSKTKETFRQILNAKTGKLENFIWKNDKWQKSGKLSQWQNPNNFEISESYKNTHEYDYRFLSEANQYYITHQGERGLWHSPGKCLYDFCINYISKPVIHQILQIQSPQARQTMYSGKGEIEKIYGTIPNVGKTMFAKLGVNKYQFNNPSVIVYMKSLLNTANISYIDDQNWDKYTTAFYGDTIDHYKDRQIIDFLKAHNEFSIDRWIKICALSKQHLNAGGNYYRSDIIKQLYKDYYTSLATMNEFDLDISAYPLLFNDKQQLQRYHDEASIAVSGIRNRAQDEKFQILYEKRKKMLENDGQYLIDMPKCSAHLTIEGSQLHHCVGGYVNSVANGYTAIYFLRKASEPDTPWLTVEVQDKCCRQIHGACNAWMGSNDEYFDAVPFLVWWFEKHEIQYNDNLLTNKATGYTGINERRPMPMKAIKEYASLHETKK